MPKSASPCMISTAPISRSAMSLSASSTVAVGASEASWACFLDVRTWAMVGTAVISMKIGAAAIVPEAAPRCQCSLAGACNAP